MSGLAAGIRLAYYNHKVCILEKHYLWGGLNSFYRMKGYRFDVGLHAMTNYVPKGVRNAPLSKLLRQLRIRHDEFGLYEQSHSSVRFLDKTLTFTNEPEDFYTDVCETFPDQADGFRKLVQAVRDYNELDLSDQARSAREVVESHLTDTLLVDMLFCPLMFYGSARENDMDWDQFVVMFKSLFEEGFARPYRGVRQILEVLIQKYKDVGGALRLKTGVQSIVSRNGAVACVRLDSGEEITARTVISSAGLIETMNLIEGEKPPAGSFPTEIGQLTFMESISVLDEEPKDLGFGETIVFFNNRERFRYEAPEEPIDVNSGVICCPNNYKFDKPLDDKLIRITNIARFDAWGECPDEEYYPAKEYWYNKSVESVLPYVSDFRGVTRFKDVFTPRTIKRYTGHLNGAVYGAPSKIKDGRTHLSNLFLCGTDQGFLGIVGAMLSGITIANFHVLQASAIQADTARGTAAE